MSSEVEKSRLASKTIQAAVAGGAASAVSGEQSGNYSLTRRLVFLLLVMLGLAGAVAMQAKLSEYAASGGGAAQVSAPPGTVALSLAFCIGVALLLSRRDLRGWWRKVAHRRAAAQARYAMADVLPESPHTRRSAVRHRHAARRVAGGARASRPQPAGSRRYKPPASQHAPTSRQRYKWAHAPSGSRRYKRRSQAPRGTIGAASIWRLPGVLSAWRGWLCAGVLLLALVASLIADVGAQMLDGRPAAQWWWIASVALLLAAAGIYMWIRKRAAGGAARQARKATIKAGAQEHTRLKIIGGMHRIWRVVGDPLLLFILLDVALLLRLPGLTDQPYIVHGDEAACGLEAYRWLNGGVPSLLSVGWYGLPVLGYGYPALVMRLVGADLFGLRLSSVIIGVLSIALLYALAREFAGRRVAFVAAALLAVAHIDIQFSRMGIHYIHAPFVVLLTLWMLARALRKNSALAAAVAGIGMSLAMQVYFSARIIFAIVPLFLIGLLLLHRTLLKGRLLTLGWMALSLLVAFGPLGIYFLQDTDALKARSAEVLILNMTSGMRDHLISQFGTANLSTVLLRQLAAVPLLVGGLADQSLQYGPLYALFDALAAALMTIGFFYALFHLARPLYLLLVIWVVCTVTLGGVLTIDMPWWPRLLVMVPALCLLAALALEEMLRAVERAWHGLEWAVVPIAPGLRWRAATLTALLALVVIVYSCGQSIRHYFTEYPQEVNGNAWRAQYTDIGRYLARLPAGTQVILFSDDSLIWDYSTFQFLAPQVQGQQVDSAFWLQAALTSRSGPVLVIITPSQADAFHALLGISGALPPGQLLAQPGALGQVAFYIYRVGGE